MRKSGLIALVLVVLANFAGSCTISFDDNPSDGGNGGGGGGSGATTTLDSATADITIIAESPTLARVYATFLDSRGRKLVLRGGQAVAVNGISLTGPDRIGSYVGTISASSDYAVEVTEPTRGITTTVCTPPPEFSILTPVANGTVSLSGFTLAWDGIDVALESTITLVQTIFEADRTASFGPFVDGGEQSFTAEQLNQFQQGAPIKITLTKSSRYTSVNGFASGTVKVQLQKTQDVTPGP